MTKPFQINRRAFLGSMLAAPLLTTACQKDYGRYFDIEWDEEVELHNGEIIIVHIKRTFERVKHMRYEKWNGMGESTEISFNAGGIVGLYKRKFIGYEVSYINRSNNNWYIKLIGLNRVLSRAGSERIVQQLLPVWIVMQDGTERAASIYQEVPYFEYPNLMPIQPDIKSISHFHGKVITLDEKKERLMKYPVYKMRNPDGLQAQPD